MLFWRDLEQQRNIYGHAVIVGGIVLGLGRRLTAQLLADVESLLIYAVHPWGNRQNTVSRGFSRPGFEVRCTGAWPLPVKIFIDGQ